jgi:hypothetical protein
LFACSYDRQGFFHNFPRISEGLLSRYGGTFQRLELGAAVQKAVRRQILRQTAAPRNIRELLNWLGNTVSVAAAQALARRGYEIKRLMCVTVVTLYNEPDWSTHPVAP